MADQRVERLAKLCVKYCVEVKQYEKVLIEGGTLALPLAREIYKECLLEGAHPQIMVNPDIMYMFFKYAGEHQLRFVSPFAKFLVENIGVHISIFCDSNPKTSVKC